MSNLAVRSFHIQKDPLSKALMSKAKPSILLMITFVELDFSPPSTSETIVILWTY
jgi:hypothetical protein